MLTREFLEALAPSQDLRDLLMVVAFVGMIWAAGFASVLYAIRAERTVMRAATAAEVSQLEYLAQVQMHQDGGL